MRIEQVAPLYESVPPRGYGGTERVVSFLTEELVARGHDVTLFASGDSITRARLVPGWPQGLRLGGRPVDAVALHIAAKVAPVGRAYFEQVVRPLLDHPLVEFLGEVDDRTKEALLADAAALLFPVDWPEPFGLVLIEALACGTPVIARRRGS